MSIRSKTGQGESLTEPRRALQHFTNRRGSIRHFADYLNGDSAKEKILFFHGDGGNGKTLLLRFLRENCCKRLAEEDWEYVKSLEGDEFVENIVGAVGCTEVPSSLVDFGMEPRGEYRPKEAFSALLKMRQDLSGKGLHFPFYDFACVLYWHKTGRLSPEKLKTLFPAEEMDLVGALTDAISQTSWGSVTKSLLGLCNKGFRDWFSLYQFRKKIDEERVEELGSMDPESDLYRMFPVLFAEDLNTAISIQDAPQRVALFFDTHEAFWEVFERKYSDEKYFLGDEWLRSLLCTLDLGKGIVAVVAGREEPRWSEAARETISSQHIDTHLVGGLSSADAATYLEKAGINNSEMKDSLISYTQVQPDEVHPLYLGLCADVVFAAKSSGKEITAEEFQEIPDAAVKGKELMNRLRKYVDRATEAAISALSACRSFDRDLYVSLMKGLNLSYSNQDFDYLTEFSFVWDAEVRGEGWYRIHDLMRRLAYEQQDETTIKAHQFLTEYHRTRREQGDSAALAEQIYHANRLDAEEGIGQWMTELKQALSLSKYDFCRVLLGIRNELLLLDDVDRGLVSALEGDYYAALSFHENALIEYQEAIAAFDEVLRSAPDYVNVYNEKGVALAKIGELQAALAQHEAALDTYSQAIAAFDETLRRAPDYVHAHNNKGNALQIIGALQVGLAQHEAALDSYSRAIAAFDEVLRRAPDYVHAYNNKGNTLAQIGELQTRLAQHEAALDTYSRAIAAFDKVLRSAPDNVYANNNKGNALQGLGELQTRLAQHEEALQSYSQAIAAFDEVLRSAPDDVYAHHNKGFALTSLGKLQTRLAQHEAALDTYSQAIAAFDEALRRAPDDVYAHNNKGFALQGLGALHVGLAQHEAALDSYSRAIAAFDEALRRAPDYVQAYNNKGSTLAQIGELQTRLTQHEEALQSYSQAIAAFSRSLEIAPAQKEIRWLIDNLRQRLGS